MFIKLTVFGLVFSSVGLLLWQCLPLGMKRLIQYQSKKVKESAEKLATMFFKVSTKKLFLIILENTDERRLRARDEGR